MRMLRPLSPVLLAGALIVFNASPARAQEQTMAIEKLAEGVYGAIYSEMFDDPVQSNALIVIGDDGVAVVDSHYTPVAARATIAEIRKLTPLPVRFVITTHWHDDHVFGNQEYKAAYPDVQFVAQSATRASMTAGQNNSADHVASLIKSYTNVIARTATQLSTGMEEENKPLSDSDRAYLMRMQPVYQKYLAEFKEVTPVFPTLTFDRELTLHLGSREIRVLSFGPGNTPGDAVIFLPQEKIVAVGDVSVYPVPFIYGGFPASWVKVIASVKQLEPSMIVPGHGPVMRDFSYLDRVSSLMQAMAEQASAAVAKGLTLEEARKTFDLEKFRAVFETKRDRSRDATFDASILRSGVAAAYREAKAAAEKGAM